MARKVRLFVENTPQHVLLKSLNGLSLFQDAQDFTSFKNILIKLHSIHEVEIHAYVILQDVFEFIATPKYEESLAKFMQSLGRNYVVYFNKKYKRSGTIWEGRYKSSLVEDTKYLFDVMSYIEHLAPKEYMHSSVGKNLYARADSIVTPHSLYKQLGFSDAQRLENYTEVFEKKADVQKYTFIKLALEKQLVTGSEQFIKNLEQLIGMALVSKGRGRPKKQTQEQRKKMYKNLVVLDKEKHKDLKLNPLESLAFAKTTPFIPVIASEVTQVGAAFPVVFSADEEPALIGLVSLGGDSLAINEEGKWVTSYVPSFLRKYPFSLAATKDNPDQKVILIDEDSALFSKSKGKQLFKKSGDQSETLEHAISFLTSFENEAVITKNVAKVIAQSGILEDREIAVGEGDEKKVLVDGFKVVDREKLNALSDDILADWVRKGIMTMIDAHLKSLENIQTLFNIAHQRQN